MRMSLLIATLLAACAFTIPAAAQHEGHAPAGEAAHHHHHEAPLEAILSPAQPYASDAPLRRNMQAIHASVGALGHLQHGAADPAQAALLGDRIAGNVRDIIANCELAPDADTALHTIIAPLLQGAQAIEADPQDLGPIGPMRDALSEYARLFDDPGFAGE